MTRFRFSALGASAVGCVLLGHSAEAAQSCDPWVGRTVTLVGKVHWNDYDASKNRYTIYLQDACSGLVDVSGPGALPCAKSAAVAVTGRLQGISDDVFLAIGDYVISNPVRVECR
jgi:hypothetical protein